MIKIVKRIIRQRRVRQEIDPDEIFIDSSNLPKFDTFQFEGRIEKSISRRTLFILGTFFVIIFLIYIGKIWSLQITQGDYFFQKSENNRLRNSLIFAKRGIIYDRNNVELAWNVENEADKSFGLRKYIPLDGFSHLLGYLKYPSKDKYGFYYSDIFVGKDGVEKSFDQVLSGKNGKRIVEVDALGNIQSENIIDSPTDGENLKLSIDAGVQNEMFRALKSLSARADYVGGAGVIINVNNGEVLALTSYPEYNSQVLTDGNDKAKINSYLNSKSNPFLNRAIDGLYTPGSTIKPFLAYAALSENIIDPFKNILSTGSISIPNPYDPTKPTVFKDWKAHGYTDMRKALAVSSDVYFYAVGGGYQDQKGLGIRKIDDYMRMFGFSIKIPPSSVFFDGPNGTIPTPEWKVANFAGEEWRVGNTYHTSIGQYGFQVSPLQLARADAAIANGGKLIVPEIIFGQGDKNPVINLNLNSNNLKVVREGMYDAVNKDYGVAKGLLSKDYSIAAKTGTAEVGLQKQYINSWISGFFPYENPQYAFVLIAEKGSATNTTGARSAMREVFDWMAINRPEYLR